jgi:hypothetical protein
MSLFIIGQQITIYLGISLVVLGLLGNGINILVFSTTATYRKNPTTFYFLITSVYNISYIVINLISRIIISGYGIDLTARSLAFCKIRPFCLAALCLISLSCCCLATIDQFLTTSQNAYIRSFSSIKWSHRIVIIVILVWFLHGIPFLMFYEISSTTHLCVNTNTAFAIYFPTIYILTLNCAIPVVVMIVFGYLAYMNIQQTRVLVQHQADRQLTAMVLITVFLVVVSYVPYGIYNGYLLIVSTLVKDNNRLALENLFGVIVNLTCYLYFSVCFERFFFDE